MVAKKRKSKRQTLQQKFRVIKRVREHKKKLKKGALTNASNHKKKVENRIPNAWPYKEELLKEIQDAKEKMEEQRLRQKEKRREEVAKRRGLTTMEVDDNEQSATQQNDPKKNAQVVINAMEAAARADDYTNESDNEEDGAKEVHSMKAMGQNSRRAFLGELKKLVERADVILQVLDARDPNGTKSTAVEDMVMANYRKKLVYVVNKADLVPKEVLEAWLKFLRQSHPAVPFKCNTQSQRGHLGSSSGKVSKQSEDALQTSQAIGAEELLNLLKNYCRVGESKSIITVGIVGFPNVGKSSLINSLTRMRSVGVSPQPGYTKVAQEVILDKNIRLIDSPGIVFADGQTAATALRNCVNVESMEDIITPVQAIVDKCPAAYLMQVYSIPRFPKGDAMAFLALVARATGKLKKGGIPNADAAARTVLHDWNNGKIKYYCKPPAPAKKSSSSKGETVLETTVLPHYSKELDLSQLTDADMRVMTSLYPEGKSNNGNDNNGLNDLYVGVDELTAPPTAAMEE
eukprot:gene5942-6542_t